MQWEIVGDDKTSIIIKKTKSKRNVDDFFLRYVYIRIRTYYNSIIFFLWMCVVCVVVVHIWLELNLLFFRKTMKVIVFSFAAGN